MKIISRERDYYDSVNAGWYSADDSIVFVRSPVVIEAGQMRDELSTILDPAQLADTIGIYFELKASNSPFTSLQLRPLSVLFCGARYTGIETVLSEPWGKVVYECFYDEELLLQYLESVGVSDRYMAARRFSWTRTPLSYNKRVSAFLNTQSELSESQRNFLIEHKITIATMTYDTYTTQGRPIIEVNDTLEKYQFYRTVDAYTAHQEIDMWLGGILAYPPNFMVDIADEYRVAAHGFDTKYGFRKRPSNRRKK